jgi:hypothetical protein
MSDETSPVAELDFGTLIQPVPANAVFCAAAEDASRDHSFNIQIPLAESHNEPIAD